MADEKKTMEKVARYIEVTQPLIDQHNENRNEYIKRAHQVAGVLANRGIIARDRVNSFVDKCAADESGTEVWNLVEKLAACLPVDELGKIAEVAADGVKYDAFERLALFGDARADTRAPGMVE